MKTYKDKQEVLKNFQALPGVGKAVANDLWRMGYRSVEELKNKNSDELYAQLNKLTGTTVDRCMLYTFRCIVYYISNKKHDPKLLKWWNWKD
jgi:hypothetical protein